MNGIIKAVTLISFIMVSAGLAHSQPKNLLKNPNADNGREGWRLFILFASVEQSDDANPHFALRNGWSTYQDVLLPEGSAGKFALLIGRVSADKINRNDTKIGLPAFAAATISKIEMGLSTLTSSPGELVYFPPATIKRKEWVTLSGRFKITDGTVAIRFVIGHHWETDWDADEKSIKNLPAARIDDLGLYVFDTEEEADVFVTMYNERMQ